MGKALFYFVDPENAGRRCLGQFEALNDGPLSAIRGKAEFTLTEFIQEAEKFYE